MHMGIGGIYGGGLGMPGLFGGGPLNNPMMINHMTLTFLAKQLQMGQHK